MHAANGKPSAGAVYRCIYAKDGLMEITQALHSPWDFSGWCTYNWLTYQEVYGIQPSRLVPPFVLVASIQHHGNWGMWRKDLSKKKRLHSSTNWFFDKIKQASGGCVRLILFGAAPLPKHIEEFLRVTSCCVLSQGYGNAKINK